MKKTIYLISLIAIMLSASACQQDNGANKSSQLEIQESKPINPPIHSDRIKNATLLIRIESIQPDRVVQAFDMGTLVQYWGETYLVTHNHYGDMLEDKNIIQLRDADNHKIRSISGFEFRSLIVYHDPGTLVLLAPDGLTDVLTPVNVDHQPQLQPGDIVQVAYRGGAERDKVEILDAVIEEITLSGGTPVCKLRFPDGKLPSSGDSGGGVWFGESFVGNTWSIVLDDTVVETPGIGEPVSEIQTNFSYAAIFAKMFLQRQTR